MPVTKTILVVQPAPTLAEVLADYAYCRRLKPSTAKWYHKILAATVSDWLSLPINAITPEMIKTRHVEICDTPSLANGAGRALKALFNYSMGEGFGVEYANGRNPTKILTDKRLWYRKNRSTRDKYLDTHQLRDWWSAVQEAPEPASDLLVFLLLTGFRYSEATRLTWNKVDLENRVIRLKASTATEPGDTKNGFSHHLPFGPYLFEMLLTRRFEANRNSCPYVFWNLRTYEPVVDIRYSVELVRDRCGIKVNPHDLRRTFVNLVEHPRIAPPDHLVKALLNHIDGSAISTSYRTISVERLRAIVEAVERLVLDTVGHTVFDAIDVEVICDEK